MCIYIYENIRNQLTFPFLLIPSITWKQFLMATQQINMRADLIQINLTLTDVFSQQSTLYL